MGARFAAAGFVSTSLDRDFGNGKILFGVGDGDAVPVDGMMAITILVPAGTRGFSMNALWDSLRVDECEVLLAHGSTYKVVSSERKPLQRHGATFNLTLQTWLLETDTGALPAAAPGASLVDRDDAPAEVGGLDDLETLESAFIEIPSTDR